MLLMLVSSMLSVADGFGETVAMLIENQKSFHAGWARSRYVGNRYRFPSIGSQRAMQLPA